MILLEEGIHIHIKLESFKKIFLRFTIYTKDVMDFVFTNSQREDTRDFQKIGYID
jgi:hypothetical protein